MKTFGKLVVALGAVALLAAPAQAQQRRGFGMFGGGTMLLTNKGVQKELKVSDEQASKLDAFAEEMQTKGREAFQGLRDLPEDERRSKIEEMMKTRQEDLNKGLAEILKPEQVKRFHQIQTQQAGSTGLLVPRVAEHLKLTEEQKSKIQSINEEMRGSMPSREDFQNDREGAMKRMADARKAATEKAVDVLTSEQKATWKDLVGAPYEVKFEPRGNN